MMKQAPSLIFVGGFLGAGKTTAMKALATMLAGNGKKVAAITNDQAAGLVDTIFLSGSGITTQEVSGSCFCCNFNGLTSAIQACIESARPDIILAEPVGSCTDIVATVIRPMLSLMGDKVSVAAFSVLVEPKRWMELAGTGDNVPWSMKYLFDRQLEEADCIAITKTDTLSHAELDTLLSEVSLRFPSARILPISSLYSRGLDTWFDFVQKTPPRQRFLQEIDYDKYAAAEAEMGWLNAEVDIEFPHDVDGVEIVHQLLSRLSAALEQAKGRVGHVKLLADTASGYAKAGTTVSGSGFDVDGGFNAKVRKMDFTINVRATLDPLDLSRIVQIAVDRFAASPGTRTSVRYLNTFRPGRPDPTYRFNRE